MSILLPLISGNSADPDRFISLMMQHPEQRRPTVVVDNAVAMVAQMRAEDMSTRNYFSHVDPDGFGPNYHLRNAGIELPYWYQQEPNANNTEIIAGGYANAEDAFAAFLTSPGHRMFLLGQHAMYEQQTRIGIGWSYKEGSTYKPVWAVITCPT